MDELRTLSSHSYIYTYVPFLGLPFLGGEDEVVGERGEFVEHQDMAGPYLGDGQEGFPLAFPKGVAGGRRGRRKRLGGVLVPQGLGLDS